MFVLREMEIIEIDRRSSGHAFEVILKGPNPNGSPAPKLKSPKMAISKDTIMLKLNAAEERRKVCLYTLSTHRCDQQVQ